MPTKQPTISKVVEQACIDVQARAGYDVNIAEGRAFNKALWTLISRMPKAQAIKYIANSLKRYGKGEK